MFPSLMLRAGGRKKGKRAKINIGDVTPKRSRYLDQTATATAIVVAILLTDHLFSPIVTTVKQLAFARPQLVQKPCALSSTYQRSYCRILREAPGSSFRPA